MQNIPITGGSYILWLKLARKRRLTIGKLGTQLFQPGYYAYCGSAFGPGGLKARLGHHLKKADHPHWHIDYLKNIATCQEIWLSTEPENLEHLWSGSLAKLPNAVMPVNGFGSSDCTCQTHLIYLPQQYRLNHLKDAFPEIVINRLKLF